MHKEQIKTLEVGTGLLKLYWIPWILDQTEEKAQEEFCCGKIIYYPVGHKERRETPHLNQMAAMSMRKSIFDSYVVPGLFGFLFSSEVVHISMMDSYCIFK